MVALLFFFLPKAKLLMCEPLYHLQYIVSSTPTACYVILQMTLVRLTSDWIVYCILVTLLNDNFQHWEGCSIILYACWWEDFDITLYNYYLYFLPGDSLLKFVDSSQSIAGCFCKCEVIWHCYLFTVFCHENL